MKITSTKGTATVDTIDAAAAWLVEMQPSYASIDGHDIESADDAWTTAVAIDAIAAAIAEGDWYWIDGSAYCPACVECDSPAIDAVDATRGPCECGRCACCGHDNGNDQE